MLDHPDRALFFISLAIGAATRIYFAMVSGGFYHPDETYQSLEPAHYLVYGYGRLPPEFSQTVPNETYYAKSRSWLFPLIFATFMRFEEGLGLDYYTVILPSMFFIGAVMSFLLIFAVRYFVMVVTKDERMALVASSLIALFPGITKLTSRLLTNTFLLPILFFAIGKAIQIVEEEREPNKRESILLVIGLGMTTYMRTDLVIPILFFAIYSLIQFKNKQVQFVGISSLYPFARLGALGWLIGMLVDFRLYEGKKFSDLWQVPYNWFGFNIIEGKSKVFGTEPYGFYYRRLIIEHNMKIWITLALFTIVFSLSTIYYFRGSVDPMIQRKASELLDKTVRLMKFFITGFFIWNVYEWPFENGISFSAVSHKEIRFVANAWVLLYILIAIVSIHLADMVDFLVSFYQFPRKMVKLRKVGMKGLYAQAAVLFLLVTIIFGQFQVDIQHVPAESLRDMNLAVEWVGQQDNVKGVVIFLPWYYSGGYTHLHKNVPLATATNMDTSARIKYLVSSDVYNYIVVSKYMKGNIPNLQSLMYQSGWKIVYVSEYSAEVWFKS